ncbi:stage II sporulation protein R [Heyndrickxia acidicola]|uniref:Stage II sporulation protein R n=1 Tax=Heyndrickxia acidicola TaxID=209389 RepID=A0ABU6ME23_9BACI|nr:stage II sporulation protein R [Heyndrickxia acidicola]MED1202909.1 stage II sporulation protein R [Heyndrickxia acidicola]
MQTKTLAWLYIIILSIGTILSLYIPKQEAAAKESIVIPHDAIRLRILANSDQDADQAVKEKIRDAVNLSIEKWVKDLTSKEKAKEVIVSHLPEIERIAKRVMAEQKMHQSVKVEFGQVQFPTKLYGDYLYPAGMYQAVLITLGKGEGANWWCVLYPPLCFLDFSNGVAVSKGFEDDEQSKQQAAPVKQASQKPKVKNPNKSAANNNQNKKTENASINKTPAVQPQSEPDTNAQASQVYAADSSDSQKVEVRFFIVDLFEKLF